MEQLSDEELISRFRSSRSAPHDEPHINELFRRYYQKVSLWCLRYTNSRDAAADLAHEVFITVYRNLDSFRGQSKFSTWLYTVTRNQCLNAVQSAAARQQQATDALTLDVSDGGLGDPLSALESSASAKLLRQWISEELDETEKRVVYLHYSEELPLEAVTRTLSLTNSSGAKAYIVSARRKLQRAAERWKARAYGKSGT